MVPLWKFYAHDPIELMSPYAVTLETSRDRRYSLYQKGWRNIRKVLDEIRYNSKAVNTYTKVFDDGFSGGNTNTFHSGYFTPYDVI